LYGPFFLNSFHCFDHSSMRELDSAVSAAVMSFGASAMTNMNEITGGTPYGASTLANADGSRQPSANELDGARYQGKHVAQITAKLTRQ
jgi:multimeric flavodoxin WrbA